MKQKQSKYPLNFPTNLGSGTVTGELSVRVEVEGERGKDPQFTLYLNLRYST